MPGQPLPTIQKVWADPHTGRVILNAVSSKRYQHWLQLDFEEVAVNMTLWFGKTPDPITGTAAGQQAYIHFNPAGADPARWVMDEQGTPVPITFSNQCSLRHYHCVWSGLSHPSAGLPDRATPIQIASMDSPLVAYLSEGETVDNIMHMDLSEDDEPDMSRGMYWNLMNTLNGAWVRQYPWKD